MIYVLFHKSCPDGFGAAWAAWRKFGDNAKYYSKHYGDEVGYLAPKSEVYILDFSFRREVLQDLVAAGHKVKVIDHHKTAEEDLRGLPYAHFDMTKSGARLAWEFFHPGIDIPKLILAVEDGDLWKWEYDYTKAVRALLGTVEWTFETWSEFAQQLEGDPGFVKAGEVLLRYQERFVRGQVEKCYPVTICGHKVYCLNATTLISEIGNYMLARYPEAPFSSSFFVNETGEYVYSLRSRGDFDVSAIAKGFGGGGHKAAAGFKTDAIFHL